MDNPNTFARVSTREGHFTVPAAVAERAGMRVLKKKAVDKAGHPLPPKLRENKLAATPTPEPEADASADTPEE